jgi:hypothetical protein
VRARHYYCPSLQHPSIHSIHWHASRHVTAAFWWLFPHKSFASALVKLKPNLVLKTSFVLLFFY